MPTTIKRKSRGRKQLPDHVRALFMIGAGCNTQYSQAEIRQLWETYGKQFLRHLDGIDRTSSQFRQQPMIFSILNLDEAKERERLL